MTKSAKILVDEQIAQCEARIAQYTGKIAALADNPDAGPACDMMSKVLESERNFKVSLEARRDASRQPRTDRFRSPPVTGALVLVMVIAFIVGFFFLPHPHGH